MRNTSIGLAALMATAAVAHAADNVSGDALRGMVTGKTVHVATAVGTVPISFRGDGTMSGRSQGLASYTMATSDRGRWWVSGNRLCQQWEQWFQKETHCFEMRRDGAKLYWSGGGRSGTAMIAN